MYSESSIEIFTMRIKYYIFLELNRHSPSVMIFPFSICEIIYFKVAWASVSGISSAIMRSASFSLVFCHLFS